MYHIQNIFINSALKKTYQEIQFAIKNKTRVKRTFKVEFPKFERGSENVEIVKENIKPVSELIKRYERTVNEDDKIMYVYSVYKLTDSTACFHDLYS